MSISLTVLEEKKKISLMNKSIYKQWEVILLKLSVIMYVAKLYRYFILKAKKPCAYREN